MIKQSKDTGIVGTKRKRKHKKKIAILLKEINQSTGERRKIKKILTKGKTIQTKQDIPNQENKILSTTGRR